MMTRVLLPLLAVLVAAEAPAAPAPSPVVRRLALLVGVNDGGPERTRLRYATTDAQSISKVLGELGGVTPADRVLLLETGREGLMEGFARMKGLVESARASGASRVEVLLYYSGHSDDEGLLLRGERVDYGELRRALADLRADVRIAVLDSCASGAFARRKGGTPRPAFLVDSGSQVSGQAILTSSSADEASQESDRLGASFFTHHLVSGLRGAADMTRDGRVTLNEAYQFAFHETLARTERTQKGAQHPAYDIEMAGTGELVMTDLRATSATLVLADTLEGRLFVRDAAGTLVVELLKVSGRPTQLGLAPGRYQVRRELDGSLSEAAFTLTEGQGTTLSAANFASVPGEATVSRGGPKEAHEVDTSSRRRLLLNLGLVPGVSTNALLAGDEPVENRLALGVMNDGTALKKGVALAFISNVYDEELEGFSGALALNVAGRDMRGVHSALALNVAAGSLTGAQLAVGVNVTAGSVQGGQFAVGVNVARGKVRGVQGTAGLNWASGAFTGLQASSGISIAQGGLEGAQVSLLNVSGDVTGAQVGLINVARRVKGTQVGLINVSEDIQGVPIGLLSFVQKGQLHLEVWSSDIQLLNAGVKLGSKYVYTTLQAGVGPDDRLQRFSLGLGFGGHIPLGSRFWLDLDAVGSNVHGFERPFNGGNLLVQGRAMLGFQIFSHLAVFVAPTYNAFFAFSPGQQRELTTFGSRVAQVDSDVSVRYWPGAQAGLRF
ncbi:caspase family protein [Melittangium boletus]|uniref:Peptidase n=1 Tax=Melittangium boletus DSM 14713 TaxID=1294270 RepID=A0A250ISK1_9BACT|nr:caspase family protein [Melittangium boletus]ATB33916.1 peptidase [Melittangium boletus DSM 14713]